MILLLVTDGDIYTVVKSTFQFTIAGAAVWAGFKIHAQWTRGDEVIPLIGYWLSGLITAVVFFALVDGLILSGSIMANKNADALASGATGSLYKIALAAGIIVSIVQIIRIYNEFVYGNKDVVSMLVQWGGALIFLYSFKYIIEAILS